MAWKLKDNIPTEPASVTDLIEGDLDEVTELNLSNKKLSRLPNDFGRLVNLRKLNVTGNELKSLPVGLAECQELTDLYLSGNFYISVLPPEWGQLQKISTFFIDDTGIETLPAGFETWPVSSLSLSKKLENQPSWPVRRLLLWKMGETEIDDVVSCYPDVDDLDLTTNDLEKLPSTISGLNLRRLILWGQNFSDFPDLRLYHHLEDMTIVACGIETLPDWIGDLHALSHLDVSVNQIETLPRQLADLGDDLDLDISNNPLIPPLDELAQQGTPALFAYLRSLPDNREPGIDPKPEPADVPEQQAAPLEVAVEEGRLVARGLAGTAEAARREFLAMHDMVKKRAAQAVQAIGGNHAKLVGLLREYQDFLGEAADALQGIPLGFAGQALAIQTEHSREEDGADLLSQDQRASLEILLAAHELLMRSVPEWQDYVLKTGQRPPLSDEIGTLVRTLSRGIVVDLRQRPKEIDRHVPDRLEELVALDAAMPADQGQLSRWGMVDALGNVLSALAKEALATAKEIPNEARKKTALGIICLGAYAASVYLGHAPELLALAQSLPGYGWIVRVINALRAMAG
ncbi:MAG: leucine-rich repeat domain-containing protein [Magnetospirillum gryphiswaldense]|nr:leucine-rich repeat domain-containing protein [Magnetospirillum gryphiswaldense]